MLEYFLYTNDNFMIVKFILFMSYRPVTIDFMEWVPFYDSPFHLVFYNSHCTLYCQIEYNYIYTIKNENKKNEKF